MNERAPGPGPDRIVHDKVVFPLFAGDPSYPEISHKDFVGTAFFVGRGLALTAAHVLESVGEGKVPVAGVTRVGGLDGYGLLWAVQLPDSDIAVFRVDIGDSAGIPIDFRDVYLDETISTIGVPRDMFEQMPDGKYVLQFRAARGYTAFGHDNWIAASFALPAGMSGSPAIASSNDKVIGVLVGQARTEIDEHLVKEFTETTATGRTTQVEKISRVEYSARIDLLGPHRDFRAAEFDGLTLAELIESEIRT